MKGSSKVIVGATAVMVVTLAFVLGLVFLLLAKLYCSLLLCRRSHHRKPATATATADADPTLPHQPVSPSLSSFCSQGVLRAPRSFLFPAPENLDSEKQPHLPMATHSGYPWPAQEPSSPASASTSDGQLIYICNPIYDHEAMIRMNSKVGTPFETPGTSPSRLETAESHSGSSSSNSITPPLTPMKKLPAEAPSVSLRDAGCVSTTGSDSNISNNYGISSSSSASPRTSPSW